MLKKQFSLETNPQQQMKANNWPPQKQPAKILDYDSDQLTEYPPLASNNITNSPSISSTLATTQQPTAMATPGYATELSLLKNEISQLKEIITMAMAQIKQAIESLHMPPCHIEQSAMETEDEDREHSTPPPPLDYSTTKQLDLPDIICDLKMT